jgi:hypothetical protein
LFAAVQSVYHVRAHQYRWGPRFVPCYLHSS